MKNRMVSGSLFSERALVSRPRVSSSRASCLSASVLFFTYVLSRDHYRVIHVNPVWLFFFCFPSFFFIRSEKAVVDYASVCSFFVSATGYQWFGVDFFPDSCNLSV